MLNAALVGLGRWGQVLGRAVHGRSEHIRIARGITRTPAKAADFARETGIPVDDDFEGVLADPAIDAVVLATPHSQHVEQIRAAAAAGKHVFVEKPLALTAASATEAFDACAQTGVLLAVGQNRRFLPAIERIRALLADGSLGRILHVEGNFSGPSGYRHEASSWRGSAGESPLGGMTGKGLHLTDLMISLCGAATEVDARSLRQVLDFDFDDTTIMLLRFAQGPTGYLGTMTATADTIRLQVFGSKGWAEMRDHRWLTVRRLHETPELVELPDLDIERAELEAFAAAVAGERDYPVRRAEVINNIALLEAIGRSVTEGTRVPVA
ncbi:MAG: Gfo/Idh/MocA family oxidoreductase [Halofilum sp. (in: g-proteobacteria)]|nr:Gfo/Idh/MocA family oxidoreductase [Halofilum sp. (in: g-proteobacteria)]